MNKFKRITAFTLAALMILSMTGCSTNMFTDDVASYPLVPELTTSEVQEFYAKSLEMDNKITRNVEVVKSLHETYNLNDANKEAQLSAAVGVTTKLLNEMEYEYSDEDARYLDETTFNYIKAMLNDKQLSNPQLKEMKQTLGYYFVYMTYAVSSRESGTFTNTASLVGLNGAIRNKIDFESDINSTEQIDEVDQEFLLMAVDKLNKYYDENKITTKRASFSATTTGFTTDPDVIIEEEIDFTQSGLADDESGITPIDPANPNGNDDDDPFSLFDDEDDDTPLTSGSNLPGEEDTNGEEETGDENNDGNNAENSENGEENNDENGEETGEEDPFADDPFADDSGYEDDEEDEDETGEETPVKEDTTLVGIRTPGIDVEEFNRVVGNSKKQSAYMPALSMVYEVPEKTGEISGIGIYPQVSAGMTKFSLDRRTVSGTMELCFVYKDDIDNPDYLINTNIYVVEMSLDRGETVSGDAIIPDFAEKELTKLVERADRAIINCDLPALMQGGIFADMGVAILTGYMANYSNVLRQISTVRSIIGRDITNKAYLLEVETQRQEGPKGNHTYGTYQDKSLVVAEQIGRRLVITDWYTYERKLQIVPDIDPDSTAIKRMVSLGLMGQITPQVASEINYLLHELCTADTYRMLYGPFDVEGGVIERGMYDCFNSDVTMLSSSKKEDINSKLRSMLVMHGVSVTANHYAIIDTVLGGTDTQVEFTTKEVIEYRGRGDGIVMQCYYLVSNLDNKWVIDDIQILDYQEAQSDTFGTDLVQVQGAYDSLNINVVTVPQPTAESEATEQ